MRNFSTVTRPAEATLSIPPLVSQRSAAWADILGVGYANVVGSPALNQQSRLRGEHHREILASPRLFGRCRFCTVALSLTLRREIQPVSTLSGIWAADSCKYPYAVFRLYVLPQEIVDLIIDQLQTSPSTLRSCSLVSRRWTARSQKHLFSRVVIRSNCLRSRRRKITPGPTGVSHYRSTSPPLLWQTLLIKEKA
ncbi:hypothetical protein BDM02DRAFT_322136 [Thelephora ganbajun]|uniref:Uncharacterized protein n=1 Tax=Thelephora ganbajun TaxID=370292 RepID=A0ACB6ZQZ0_THEGA|nr:hypothetical protein BDM02DRAFT_322136 [Thelephora ganbajun]